LLRVQSRLRGAPGNGVPPGFVGLSEIQRVGNHVCVNEPYTWRLFQPWRSLPILANLTLEVRHRFPSRFSSRSANAAATAPVALGAVTLAAACAKRLFGLAVTVNETFLVAFNGVELVARVVEVAPEDATDGPDPGGQGPGGEGEDGQGPGGEGEDGEATGALTLPDHYRGLVEAGTCVFLVVDQGTCAHSLALNGNVTKAAAPPPQNVVEVKLD
jgi:hypothetical protein